MALRDWRPWHMVLLWMVALLALWLLLRRTFDSVSGSGASGGLSGGSAPVGSVVVVVIVLIALVIATLRWMRRSG